MGEKDCLERARKLVKVAEGRKRLQPYFSASFFFFAAKDFKNAVMCLEKCCALFTLSPEDKTPWYLEDISEYALRKLIKYIRDLEFAEKMHSVFFAADSKITDKLLYEIIVGGDTRERIGRLLGQHDSAEKPHKTIIYEHMDDRREAVFRRFIKEVYSSDTDFISLELTKEAEEFRRFYIYPIGADYVFAARKLLRK